MSATYKCNWCGKTIGDAHSYCRNISIVVPRKIYKSKKIRNLYVEFTVRVTDSSMDICDRCLKEVQKEALKTILEKYINKE